EELTLTPDPSPLRFPPSRAIYRKRHTAGVDDPSLPPRGDVLPVPGDDASSKYWRDPSPPAGRGASPVAVADVSPVDRGDVSPGDRGDGFAPGAGDASSGDDDDVSPRYRRDPSPWPGQTPLSRKVVETRRTQSATVSCWRRFRRKVTKLCPNNS